MYRQFYNRTENEWKGNYCGTSHSKKYPCFPPFPSLWTAIILTTSLFCFGVFLHVCFCTECKDCLFYNISTIVKCHNYNPGHKAQPTRCGSPVALYIKRIWNRPSQAGGAHSTSVPCPRERTAQHILQEYLNSFRIWFTCRGWKKLSSVGVQFQLGCSLLHWTSWSRQWRSREEAQFWQAVASRHQLRHSWMIWQ